MDYMHRHAEARRHPPSILPEVRSVVMVAMNYRPADETEQLRSLLADGKNRTLRPGNADYHDVLRERLNTLLAWLRRRSRLPGRGVVDTAPLLERDFARRAGLGWFGKNTMLLEQAAGQLFFYRRLLLDWN